MSAKILIVDDEPPIIEVLSYNLKRANYEVAIARDGQQALDQARREKPDLIILDLMLPLYNLRRTTPVLWFWVATIKTSSASRSGVNQRPL